MAAPWRVTKGAAPDAVQAARPVLNGGDEETGLYRPRLVATQLRQQVKAGVRRQKGVLISVK
jgi:IS5 family transposase